MSNRSQTTVAAADGSDKPLAGEPLSADGAVPPADGAASVPHTERAPAAQTDTLVHWLFLSIALAVLALAAVLKIRDDDRVALPAWDVPLPGVCTFKRITGSDCPGCGLTRCFISLARGNLQRAWSYNPSGLLLFGMVLFQVPYRIVQLWRIRRGAAVLRLGKVEHWSLMLLAVALLSQWGLASISQLWMP